MRTVAGAATQPQRTAAPSGICRAASQPTSAAVTPQPPTISAPLSSEHDAAAEDRAEQDREERAGFDERVAGDQLVLAQVLRAAARI